VAGKFTSGEKSQVANQMFVLFAVIQLESINHLRAQA